MHYKDTMVMFTCTCISLVFLKTYAIHVCSVGKGSKKGKLEGMGLNQQKVIDQNFQCLRYAYPCKKKRRGWGDSMKFFFFWGATRVSTRKELKFNLFTRIFNSIRWVQWGFLKKNNYPCAKGHSYECNG